MFNVNSTSIWQVMEAYCKARLSCVGSVLVMDGLMCFPFFFLFVNDTDVCGLKMIY